MGVAAETGGTANRGRNKPILPWVVLAIGIPASLMLYVVNRDAVESVARLRFERQAGDSKAVIEYRTQFYADILFGLKALFASQGPVSRDQFHRFVKSLDLKNRYPGFDVVNYMTYVPAEDKNRFEEMVRHDTSLSPQGYPGFAIKPPGARAGYYVIVYLEPMAGFEFAFGLDLGANPNAANPEAIAAAVRLTRDSGHLTASGVPLRIKSGNKEYIGLAMRLAVYKDDMPVDTVEQRRAAFLGSVGAGFNVENLMKGVLDEETARYMRFKLYDAGSASERVNSNAFVERRLLFDSNQLTQTSPAQSALDDTAPVFDRVLPLEVGGRIWEVHFSARKDAIIGRVDALLPWAVLWGGLLSSVLLFGMLYSLASSRSRAVKIAGEITRDLRESEASLADAQHMAHLGNWSLDPGTGRMACSAETYRILGLNAQPVDFTYADFLRRVHEDDRTSVDQALRRSIEAGQDHDVEHRVTLGDGSVRWVHTIAKPSRRDRQALVPGTIMDITDRKLAQEELQTFAEQLQALSRRLVDIQELERRRFSRELHDQVGQNLTALSINLDILRNQLSGDASAGYRSRLDDSVALLESTAGAIENVMSELRPPMLDDYGLLAALQWYGTGFSGRTGIEVKVHGDENMERMAPETEIALFRITQEALNNVAKHARARSVDIRLARSGSQFAMSVSDDGIGFDAAPTSNSRRRPGLGMVTMRERTQAIGGQFEFGAAPGRGTRVMVRIPC